MHAVHIEEKQTVQFKAMDDPMSRNSQVYSLDQMHKVVLFALHVCRTAHEEGKQPVQLKTMDDSMSRNNEVYSRDETDIYIHTQTCVTSLRLSAHITVSLMNTLAHSR